MFELSGTIKDIFDEQTFSSGFNKKEFVLTTDEEKFPQDIKFECLKDKTSLLNDFKTGDRVTVRFNIRGREWKDNYFVNLVPWKIEKAGAKASTPTQDSSPDDIPLDDEPPF
ncbi:MAG: DUF3127 domain-containing protein [Opitutales bacterium]